MHVVVFEPKFVGHFLGFAKSVAAAYLRFGHEVTLCLSKQAEHTLQAQAKLHDLHDEIAVRFVLDVPKNYDKWSCAKSESRALRELLTMSSLDFDHLSIPSADFLLAGLLLRRGLYRNLFTRCSVDAILHNCHHVYPQHGLKQRLSAIISQLTIEACPRLNLFAVDPYAVSKATRRLAWTRTVMPLPHHYHRCLDAKSQADARLSLRLPPSGWLVGSAGDLGTRKGTELLIDGFASASLGPNSHLVLLGKQHEVVRKKLNEYGTLVESGRILCCDRFVSDEEFGLFFPAVDLVWAGYPRHIGIASVLLFAADAGRPVLASNYGCVGWMVDRYGLGRCEEPTVSAVASALRWFAEHPDEEPKPAGVQELLAYHNTEQFEETLTQFVR